MHNLINKYKRYYWKIVHVTNRTNNGFNSLPNFFRKQHISDLHFIAKLFIKTIEEKNFDIRY